jgi:hypothetical protein
MSIAITSTAFVEGKTIPKRHGGDGENLSPALAWSGFPAATKSFLLIVEDPDAPSGTFTHWIIFNIPPSATQLAEGLPASPALAGIGRQGTNDADEIGYFGPCPPPGKPHRYFFRIFALDRTLDLPTECRSIQVQKAIQNHVLDRGSLMGTYRR